MVGVSTVAGNPLPRLTPRYYSPYPIPVDVSTPAPSSALGIDAEPPKKRGRKRKEAPVSDEKRILLPRSASDVMAVGVGKGGEGARGRLWVCDVGLSSFGHSTDPQLCFKYMRTRAGWDKHIVGLLPRCSLTHQSSCTMLRPPGRKVYQRDNYTMWEIDGAHAPVSHGRDGADPSSTARTSVCLESSSLTIKWVFSSDGLC